ncbi:glutamate--tRNA ligase [Paremcibacter congregatus]|uniref:Glutamate--tRNA ligase n=1 Tax=Paremcibacter congregatus TaxID=2043170 RepID=A0A2G4YSN7_9PROT|nr:glutamate--tRNA ligase [Paremcibacter congregatus]PHZ85351.1 glutamate--tRNA ligase [Paremcibacter congregatus]QDE27718.1 glutamate--tRNA ligase [Paremcibacter congregatus]
MTKKVITRFAPSPTGFLHIGGARTALFNWLFAKHHGGEFHLRIEDTDRKRLTEGAVEAIHEGMAWLGLSHDGDVISQFEQRDRHVEVAQKLLAEGKAYYCYCSPEELTEMREKARAEGKPIGYDGRWRDRDPSEAPEGIKPVVRFKSPNEGQTVIHDKVQGTVTVENTQLDDMILLRADGSPTYMLSVVVDDHDMGVTHVIRGDDHLTNAARQAQLIEAIGWDLPVYAHIPLIHGPDGAKLSKRHGALGVEAYRDMGYLPSALKNYLVRLGWAHGDDEIFSEQQAIEWFSLEGIGKSPSRFDFVKLENLNGYYIREAASNETLVEICRPLIEKNLGRPLTDDEAALLVPAMDEFKPRAKNLNDLAESTLFLFAERPLTMIPKAEKILTEDAKQILTKAIAVLDQAAAWDIESLEADIKAFAENQDLKLGKVAQPLRAALTGSNVSPGIFDILVWLGKTESLARLKDQAA